MRDPGATSIGDGEPWAGYELRKSLPVIARSRNGRASIWPWRPLPLRLAEQDRREHAADDARRELGLLGGPLDLEGQVVRVDGRSIVSLGRAGRAYAGAP